MTDDRRARPAGPRVVIAGGGTGGHLTPAIALGRALVARGAEVLLVGGTRGPDRTMLGASGLPHRLLAAPALERRRWWRNSALPWRLGRAYAEGQRIVREFRPDVAVGTGGYVSAPVVLAAARARIPILLQEQNRTPGIATRGLARFADRICLQFDEAVDRLPGGATVEVTGSPIAPPAAETGEIAALLDPARPTVGVFGASQGARAINDALLAIVGRDPEALPWNLVWQTGAADHARIDAALGPVPARVIVRPFFHRMGEVYPLLDLFVGRAGAMTLAEITAWGIPSILVPYPFATANHQDANARAMETAGAAYRVPEPELLGRRLANLIEGLLAEPARRAEMAGHARALGRPDAAATVAARVLELAEAA